MRLFPDIHVDSVERVNIGWASQVLIVNGKYVVKIPRSDESRKELEKEIQVTSRLRGFIPVKIPHFVSWARNEELHSAAYELIHGTILTNQDVGETPSVRLDDPEIAMSRMEIARQLANILNSVHSIDMVTAEEVLKPFVGESWNQKNLRRIREFKTVANSYFDTDTASLCTSFLDNLSDVMNNLAFPPRFIHGDFGGWNILYDSEKRQITGLLDWADSGIGDPAADFLELIYDFGKDFAGMVLEFYAFRDDADIMKRAETYMQIAGFQDLKYGLESETDYFIKRGEQDILSVIKK